MTFLFTFTFKAQRRKTQIQAFDYHQHIVYTTAYELQNSFCHALLSHKKLTLFSVAIRPPNPVVVSEGQASGR